MGKKLTVLEVYELADKISCSSELVAFLQETVPQLFGDPDIENLDVWNYISALSGVLSEAGRTEPFSYSKLSEALVSALYYE